MRFVVDCMPVLWPIGRWDYFLVDFASFHIHSILHDFFFCPFVSLHSLCSNAPMWGELSCVNFAFSTAILNITSFFCSLYDHRRFDYGVLLTYKITICRKLDVIWVAGSIPNMQIPSMRCSLRTLHQLVRR